MSETTPSPALRKAMRQAAAEATKRGLFNGTAMSADVATRLRALGREAR